MYIGGHLQLVNHSHMIQKIYEYDDGGRANAGFKGKTGDCVTRAIAIATGLPYLEVYLSLNDVARDYANAHKCRVARAIKRKNGTCSRTGHFREVYHKFLLDLGWKWTPVMKVGSGCTMHLDPAELPKGTIIVSLSKHLAIVIHTYPLTT